MGCKGKPGSLDPQAARVGRGRLGKQVVREGQEPLEPPERMA
jgi:hypothetical protein